MTLRYIGGMILSLLVLAACQSSSSSSESTPPEQDPSPVISLDFETQTGVGIAPPAYAHVLFDGSRTMLDSLWEYWAGPRLAAKPPIKWFLVEDPVAEGQVLNTNDPTAAGGIYGSADIVTKEKFEDFRLHIEFLIANEGGNSGVYLQNRYEIQVLDGDSTEHGLGAIINESPSPYHAYNGLGKWNAYDVVFRAARFEGETRSEAALATVYFNGQKAHENHAIQKVWGGPNSGLDGGNDDGKGITNRPGGLKLQAEGHDVLYRNIWIQPLVISEPNTNF
ncbi:MAG: DUF1080 domain-containing protein [Bacteroidota bacterium]